MDGRNHQMHGKPSAPSAFAEKDDKRSIHATLVI
jgi:hypothetical protein